jgi:hypothetical protein
MSIIATKAKELRQLVKKQESFARQIVKDSPEQVEDYNLDQLQKGVDAEGEKITPPYTPYTKAAKRAKGQPTDRVTLFDEGDFYRSIQARIDNAGFTLDATDIKTPELIDKYGDMILGLNQNSVDLLIDELILPELLKRNQRELS